MQVTVQLRSGAQSKATGVAFFMQYVYSIPKSVIGIMPDIAVNLNQFHYAFII